jgi:hypothetical protein
MGGVSRIPIKNRIDTDTVRSVRVGECWIRFRRLQPMLGAASRLRLSESLAPEPPDLEW